MFDIAKFYLCMPATSNAVPAIYIKLIQYWLSSVCAFINC